MIRSLLLVDVYVGRGVGLELFIGACKRAPGRCAWEGGREGGRKGGGEGREGRRK